MAFDKEVMFRSTGNLTEDEAGTFIAIPPGGDMELRIVVPQIAETNDTILVTITYSADGTNASGITTLPTITKAIVDAGKHEFFWPIETSRGYIKVGFDVTDADSGSDFNAGVVQAGLVPAGRYTDW